MKTILFRILRRALILAFWIAVWDVAVLVVGKPLLLPAPITVFKRLFELMQTKEFYLITVNSLWNILRGILIAVGMGCILAALTAKISLIRDIIQLPMTVIKATPVASFIILALIFIGSAKVPTFITILIVLPVIWTNLDEGYRRIDPQLVEMATVFRLSPWKRLRLLTLPSLKPYFLSACRTSIGLAWKAGVAAEIIAMPRKSIGTMIGDAKQYILTEDMFAWTLTVILLSLLIESIFSFVFRTISKKQRKAEVI